MEMDWTIVGCVCQADKASLGVNGNACGNDGTVGA